MKIKRDFIMNQTGEEYILIPVGENALHFNRIIVFTEVEAFLWKGLQDGKDRKELIRSVLNEYEVTRSVVEKDVDYFLQRLLDVDIIDSLQESEDDSKEA